MFRNGARWKLCSTAWKIRRSKKHAGRRSRPRGRRTRVLSGKSLAGRAGGSNRRGRIMLTNYQQMLVADLSGRDSYGAPLVGWKGQTEFFRNVGAPVTPGALDANLAATFVESVYVLLR